tara:strand:- start:187 stop:411 length:225 start_codon:yes stop_codon:yes gene_type:complete
VTSLSFKTNNMEYAITFLVVVLGFLVGDFLNIQIKAAIERKQERDASNVHEILMALNKEFNSKFNRDKDSFINH